MRISFAYLRYIYMLYHRSDIHIYMYTYTYHHTYMCVYMYKCICIHGYIHIHICTHVRMSSSCVLPIRRVLGVAINCTYTYTHSLSLFIFLFLLKLFIHSNNTHSCNSFHSFLFFLSNIYLSQTATSSSCDFVAVFWHLFFHITKFSKPIVTISYSHTSEFAGL